MIYLLTEKLHDGYHAALLKGKLDLILKLAEWAIADNSDTLFYKWLVDRRWVVSSAMTDKLKYLLEDIRRGGAAAVLGAPVKFIDRLAEPGYSISIACRDRETGEILKVFPTLTTLAEFIGIRRHSVKRNIFNGRTVRLKTDDGGTNDCYMTGHRQTPARQSK